MYPTLANLLPIVAVAIAPSETPTPKTFLLIQLSGLEENPLTLGSFNHKAEPNCAILLAPTTATLKASQAAAQPGWSPSRPTAKPSTATVPAGADDGGSQHHLGALADAGHLL